MSESRHRQDALVEVIEAIVGSAGSTGSLCESTLRVADVIPAEAVISYRLDLQDGGSGGCVRDGAGLGGEAVIGRLVANFGQCPVHGWHADGHDDEIAILSGITDPSAYREGAHYQAVFAGSKVGDLMSIPVGSDGILARVILCRDGEGYSEEEVDSARILQPVIAGCLRQAVVMEKLGEDPLSEEAMRERGLTPREAQIFSRLAAGATSQAVGQDLDISVRTVEKHVQNIYARIGARNRSEAISILLGKASSPAVGVVAVGALTYLAGL